HGTASSTVRPAAVPAAVVSHQGAQPARPSRRSWSKSACPVGTNRAPTLVAPPTPPAGPLAHYRSIPSRQRASLLPAPGNPPAQGLKERPSKGLRELHHGPFRVFQHVGMPMVVGNAAVVARGQQGQDREARDRDRQGVGGQE